MGEVLALGAGIGYALNTMLTQRAMRKASASASVLVNLLVNNLIFIAFGIFALNRQVLSSLTIAGALYAAAAGLVGNVIGRNFTYQAVRRIGSARTTLLSLTQTLFEFIWGLVLIGEIPSLVSVTGIVLIMLGVYLLTREQVRKAEKPAADGDGPDVMVKRRVQWGLLLALGSGLAFSGADLFRKMSLRILPSAIVSSGLGGLTALAVQSLILTQQKGWGELRRLDKGSLLNLLLAGTAGGCAIVAMNAALSHTHMVVVNSLYSIRIWFIIALGPLLLGAEGKITKTVVGSAVVILTGTFIIICR